MNENKIKACTLAYELTHILDEIPDMDFADTITQAIEYAEDYRIIELKDSLLEG